MEIQSDTLVLTVLEERYPDNHNSLAEWLGDSCQGLTVHDLGEWGSQILSLLSRFTDNFPPRTAENLFELVTGS